MEICAQHFSTEIINRIRATVNIDPAISRRALSRQVCQWLNWRGANGKLKDMSCRKALLELERREVISLPVIDKTYAFQRESGKITASLLEIKEVECPLRELGNVDLVPVPSRYSKASHIFQRHDEYLSLSGSRSAMRRPDTVSDLKSGLRMVGRDKLQFSELATGGP